MMGMTWRDIRNMDFTFTAITRPSHFRLVRRRGATDDARIIEQDLDAAEIADCAFNHALAIRGGG